jgi:TerC family integral membrane protein
MSEKNSQDGSSPASASVGSGLGSIPSGDHYAGQLPLPGTSLPYPIVPSTQQSESESAYLFVEEEINLEDAYEKAILQTLAWVAAAGLFGLGLIQMVGLKTGEEFFAGYLVEQSLSVDNLFVFLLLFDYFKVPLPYQGRVLKWGIFGAIIMRAIMIGLGAAALKSFHPILLLFASFLVYSSFQTLSGLLKGSNDDEEEGDVGDDVVVKFTRRWLSSVDYFDGDKFFTLVDGVKKATPLMLCMVAVEISDVVFAVDSIPAVFGVTEVS